MSSTGGGGGSDAEPARAAAPARKQHQRLAQVASGLAVAYVTVRLGIAVAKRIGKALKKGSPPPPQVRADAAPAAAPAAPAGPSEDSWSPVDLAPPDAPAGFKLLTSLTVSCTPQELYQLLFSGPGAELYTQQHREVAKHWETVATPWRRASPGCGNGATAADSSLLGGKNVFEFSLGQHIPGSFARLLTFWNPKKPGSPDTRCVQRQQFVTFDSGSLVFVTAMNMLDIPFKDCFTVNTFWRVDPGPAPGTSTVTIQLKVFFVKSALGVGGIIASRTFAESREFFAAFLANVEAKVAGMRAAAGAPLPAPLPGVALAASRAPGARAPAGGAVVSPFAAASGAVVPTAGGAAARQAAVKVSMASWKQMRALIVFVLLTITILHQLHLGYEIAAIRMPGSRAAAGGAGGAADAGSGGGLMGAASDAVAGLAGPAVGAAGSVHVLLSALAERLAATRGPVAGPQ